jgi:predicted dehydrogenase
MPLTVAILGAGRWGQAHIRTLTSLKIEGLIKQLFVCDIDADIGNRCNLLFMAGNG